MKHRIEYLHEDQIKTFTSDEFGFLTYWAEKNLPNGQYEIIREDNGQVLCNQDGPIDDPGTYGVVLEHMSSAGALYKQVAANGGHLLRVAMDRYYIVQEVPSSVGWDLEVCGWDGKKPTGVPVRLARLQTEAKLSERTTATVPRKALAILESMMHAHARSTRPNEDGSFATAEAKLVRMTDGRELVATSPSSYLCGEAEADQALGQSL